MNPLASTPWPHASTLHTLRPIPHPPLPCPCAPAGFAAVMEAIQDSGKPAVGHNLAFDLSYSLHSFAQELPGSWDEYKGLVGRWFPGGVYDTKHLSGTCAALCNNAALLLLCGKRSAFLAGRFAGAD